MKKLYAFSLAFFIVIGSGAQTKRLSIIGSSTSACFAFPLGISDPDCYVNKLITYYNGQGVIIDLRNLAVSGTNVYNGMPDGYPTIPFGGAVDPDHNISEALSPTSNPSWHPDAVIVNFPTNQYQNLDLHAILSYFRIIKKTANDAGRVCFITTTQPRDDYDAPTRAKLKELRDSIMAQYGPFAIDFWTTLAKADGSGMIEPLYARGDGIHLNTAGHTILFQRVQAADIFNSTLPVHITAFSAKAMNKGNDLKWAVVDEAPGTIYKIERSEDGIQFQTMAQLNGTAAALTNASYEFLDKTVAKQSYYYRIEVNESGRIMYSRVERCASENKVAMSVISASSTITKLNISSFGRYTIRFRLMNSEGAIIATYLRSVQPGNNLILLQHPLLQTGVYWIDSYDKNEKLFAQGFWSK
jgi:hypothetical protein